MGLFNNCHEEWKLIRKLIAIIEELLEKKKHHSYQLILTKLVNNSIVQIMALELQSNQSATAGIALKDSVTGELITNADFRNVTATSDNEAVVVASVDPDGITPRAKAVAEGSGNIVVSADVTWTDNLGAPRGGTFQSSTPVTVTAVIVGDAVELVVTWGTPVITVS